MAESTHTRRDVLALLAVAGMAAACRAASRPTSASNAASTSSTAPATTTPTPTPTPGNATCLLSPEQTEGPFFIPGEAVRADITEGSAGLPLRLAFVVADVARCAPVANASIDIWHADASGNYSGFNGGAASRSFLRGIQVTDSSGAAGFRTVYPGWYQGRATHIHVKVNLGGNVVHTGQLYFDDSVSQAVYAGAPYNARTGRRTLNGQDGIYAGGGAESTLRLTPEGRGYVGAITLGVRPRATAS